MITVGFDFGTHQTKICVEEKEGVELNYSFFKFADDTGKMHYTLPSIIQIDKNDRLLYGYIPPRLEGKIIRYFKQATFTRLTSGPSKTEAILYSIWYVAYILFDLENKYGQAFSIQMGVPSDGAHLDLQKQLAVRILTSAYRLVEDVFKNDKTAFLSATVSELTSLTEFLDYSKNLKEEYAILVFPEAYACLMPLISSSKIEAGMSLMVDIGGGTTDISFFTIKSGRPQVYDFNSVNKGLNFLTDAENRLDEQLDSNVKSSSEINKDRKKDFISTIKCVCQTLIIRLRSEFSKQCRLEEKNLMDALKCRPIIYTGGGSTFKRLRVGYGDFKDVIHISEKEWRTEAISELNTIKALGLCPILSTAYGLSISVANDNIKCEPFQDIFETIRCAVEKKSPYQYGKAYGGFDYGDDWNAWK